MIPKQWAWIKTGDICEIVGGSTPDTKDSSNFEKGDIAWITPADLSGYTDKYISKGARNITLKGLQNCSTKIVNPGTVLFSSRAPIGYVAIAAQALTTNQGFKSFVPPDDLSSDYLYYYLKFAKHLALDLASGTTFKEISGQKAALIPLPLPPLAEQHRIVAKIEELFSELDKGVETLRTAQQQLKVYRQAVLQWAFEGKLTEEWRRKNSEKLQLLRCVETVGCNEEKMELPSEWRLTNLSSVGEAIDPHPSHRTPPVVENGIPYVGIAECDYKKYAIDFDSARKVSPDVLKEHTARYLINKDDFIIGKIGTIGKPFKVPSERFFALSANVVLVQPDRILINADYVFYLFQSQVIEKQFSQGLKATTQAAFGIQKVRLMKIPYCSLPEQHQIVAEIESRLSVCDKLEETIAQSLLQAEALRQSILKQAFAGKLVPQDPSDEPVEKLLARIRAERAAANPDKIKSAKRKVK